MRIAKFFLNTLQLAIVITIIAIASIISPIGRNYIKNYIENEINLKTNYKVKLARIYFDLPLVLKVKAINLSDENGEFAKIQELKISIIPSLDLLKKEFIFDVISAKVFELIKIPEIVKVNNAPSSLRNDFNEQENYIIKIDKINIDKLIILNSSSDLNINGSLKLLGPTNTIDGHAIISMKEGSLNIKAIYNFADNILKISDAALTSEYLSTNGNLELNTVHYNFNGLFHLKSEHINTDINFIFKDQKFILVVKGLLYATFDYKKDQDLILLNNLKIEDEFKDYFKGDLKFNNKTKKISGDVQFSINNLNKIYSDLKGSYKGLLKFKNTVNNQLFDLNLNASKLPIKYFKSINIKLLGDYNDKLLNLEKLRLNIGAHKISNSQSITLALNQHNIGFDVPRLKINSGYLNIKGEVSKEFIDAKGSFVSLNLVNFSDLFLPPAHQLTGVINGKLDIIGNIKDPNIQGNIKIANGIYKNFELGGIIEKINIEAEIKESKISTKYCKFFDSKGIQANCKFDLDLKNNDKNFSANINADNFYLLLPTIGTQGNINADLKLEGNAQSANLTGKINIVSAEIKIPEHFGPKIYELNIVEKKKNVQETSASSYPLNLNIHVVANHKLFVRGWGLNIELKGDLNLSNLNGDFSTDGKLSIIRGRYQEFGKYFNIAKGELKFEKSIPPSPYIDVIGTTVVDSNQINLELSGPLLEPNLSIYSNPPLAQEEALSLVLFNKKSDNITAFQAISLANSLKRLSGHGGGNTEILGKARKILHIDDISFTQDDKTGNTKVGVGKYISEKVYLKIEQAVESGAATTSIEYELRPHISFEGITGGGEGDSIIGINWKKDF